MRILVTGGCGFIGSNFLYLLFEEMPDAFVCNVDLLTYAGNAANLDDLDKTAKERHVLARADIADPEAMRRLMREHRIEAVVNFAAETHVDRSIHDPAPFLRTNVNGTQNLLVAARECGVARFVHVSTDEVYGSLGPTGRFREDSPLEPNSPYSASKAAADLLCRAWFQTYGFPVLVTRCSNNYGPYQFPEKLIPFMYHRAMRGEKLPVYGDGAQVRDWIHVRDHCRGVLLTLQKGRPGAVYNFGGNAERANLAVVRRILAFCGRGEDLIEYVKDRPGHDRRYAMDYSLAARELGFAPSFSFEEGLEQTLCWYREHQNWAETLQQRRVAGADDGFEKAWYGDRL